MKFVPRALQSSFPCGWCPSVGIYCPNWLALSLPQGNKSWWCCAWFELHTHWAWFNCDRWHICIVFSLYSRGQVQFIGRIVSNRNYLLFSSFSSFILSLLPGPSTAALLKLHILPFIPSFFTIFLSLPKSLYAQKSHFANKSSDSIDSLWKVLFLPPSNPSSFVAYYFDV